jgi:hypothetical protein
VIEAVLFDGDQTLWDFERVMHDASTAVAEDLRRARPCGFTEALRWEDPEADRAAVGVSGRKLMEISARFRDAVL